MKTKILHYRPSPYSLYTINCHKKRLTNSERVVNSVGVRPRVHVEYHGVFSVGVVDIKPWGQEQPHGGGEAVLQGDGRYDAAGAVFADQTVSDYGIVLPDGQNFRSLRQKRVSRKI